MAVRGKQRWTPVDALKRQFDEGKDYIACPKCKAFLGDNKPFRPVQNFARQHTDGREHLTCPKCHALLGRVYWDAPTIGDRIRYFNEGNVGWKGCAIGALIVGTAAMLLYAFHIDTLELHKMFEFGFVVSVWMYVVIRAFVDGYNFRNHLFRRY